MNPPTVPGRSAHHDAEARTFEKHLHGKGLRMTRERRRILDEVLGTEGHFRPEDLLVRFRTGGVQVSRATIYRTLDLLVEATLVRRETFAGHPSWRRCHGAR